MRSSFRNRILFVGHETVHPLAVDAPLPESRLWMNYTSDDPEKQWLVEATECSTEHAAFYRSVYMRWAITINALHVARDRYASLDDSLGLVIKHIHMVDGVPQEGPLDIWKASTAAENYELSIPLMAAYGIQDLFGAMEEIIFDLYEIYLNGNPTSILEGNDFRDMRRIYREREDSEEKASEWAEAWANRLKTWRRKRLYDGLHRVFKSFWERAGLKRPSHLTHSDIDDWCKTIETVSEVRNLITHGENHVSQRLHDLCAEQPHLGFEFKFNEVLEIKLEHLMIVEKFFSDVIKLLNDCLMDRAAGRDLGELINKKDS